MPLFTVIMGAICIRAFQTYLCDSSALTVFLEIFQNIALGEAEVLKRILTQYH